MRVYDQVERDNMGRFLLKDATTEKTYYRWGVDAREIVAQGGAAYVLKSGETHSGETNLERTIAQWDEVELEEIRRLCDEHDVGIVGKSRAQLISALQARKVFPPQAQAAATSAATAPHGDVATMTGE